MFLLSCSVTGRGNVDVFIQLMITPLDTQSLVSHSPIALLSLQHYTDLMSLLEYTNRVRVAKTVAQAVSRRGKHITQIDKLERLLSFLSPLMRDEPGAQSDVDEMDFAEEQGLIARLVHLVDNTDTDALFAMIDMLREKFKQGGERRQRFTYVPLIFRALQLVQRVKAREAAEPGTFTVSCKRVLSLIYDVGGLTAPLIPEVALPLFLQAAHVAAEAGYEQIAYEFVTQVRLTFEVRSC